MIRRSVSTVAQNLAVLFRGRFTRGKSLRVELRSSVKCRILLTSARPVQSGAVNYAILTALSRSLALILVVPLPYFQEERSSFSLLASFTGSGSASSDPIASFMRTSCVVSLCLSFSSDEHHRSHSCLGTGMRVGIPNTFVIIVHLWTIAAATFSVCVSSSGTFLVCLLVKQSLYPCTDYFVHDSETGDPQLVAEPRVG